MTYAHLKTILNSQNATQVFGIQLTSGEEIQFSREGRSGAAANVYHTRWALNDTLEALAVIHPISTMAGPAPVIISYYPAECIMDVQLFLTTAQIIEDDTFVMAAHNNTTPVSTFTDPLA